MVPASAVSTIGGWWVFTDARRIAAGSTLQADICIIGAGIAGISIAREFVGRREHVVLLEGGSLDFTKSLRNLPTVLRRHSLSEQALSSGRSAGLGGARRSDGEAHRAEQGDAGQGENAHSVAHHE